MAIAKKAGKKKEVFAAGARGTSAPKQEEEKKKLVLIVFKSTHGGMFNKHSHYSANLMQVDDRVAGKAYAEAAVKAARKANEILPMNTEVVIAEEIEITTTDTIKEKLGELFKH